MTSLLLMANFDEFINWLAFSPQYSRRQWRASERFFLESAPPPANFSFYALFPRPLHAHPRFNLKEDVVPVFFFCGPNLLLQLFPVRKFFRPFGEAPTHFTDHAVST